MNPAQGLPHFGPTDNEVLADRISELAAHIHAATYRFLVLLREFDEREAWAEMGARTCAHWLNWRCGINVHTAREKVRVAHALAALPKISTSFERGELSYSKVRAVTRVATPDNEDTLLNIALSGSASQLERVVRCEIRAQSEELVEEQTQAAFENRSFSWSRQADGSVEFFGRLPAELAEYVIKMINANLPRCLPVDSPDDSRDNSREGPSGDSGGYAGGYSGDDSSDYSPDESVGNFPEYSLDDSLGNSQGVPVVESHSGIGDSLTKYVPAGTPAPASLHARRADALVAMCSAHCDGYEVTLHVPAGTSLRANALKETGTIPAEAAKRICCDASVVPVSEDHHGNVLDIGRRTRKIPPAIRRALEIRDKGCCRFPGCDSQRFLKGHHMHHWAHGGKTSLDNLVLLCWQHHHLVHEGGFGCRAVKRRSQAGVHIIFSTPRGVMIPDAFGLPAAKDSLEHQQRALNIDTQTCVARDAATPLDVNTVIDALAFFRQPK